LTQIDKIKAKFNSNLKPKLGPMVVSLYPAGAAKGYPWGEGARGGIAADSEGPLQWQSFQFVVM